MNALLSRTIAVAGLLSLGIAGSIVAGPAVLAHPSVVGHVYVNDNTAGVNTVAGFNRFADGTLAPIPGSPFTAGGAGTGVGHWLPGALQFAKNGRLLLAVDAGSNSISVLRVHGDGSLSRTRHVVYSGGDSPDVSRSMEGSSTSQIAAVPLRTTPASRWSPALYVRPIAGSTFSLPAGTVIGDVLFNGSGRRLVGTRVDTTTAPSEIDSFSVDAAGYLHAAPGSPFAASPWVPSAATFALPTQPVVCLECARWSTKRNGLSIQGSS